MLKSKSVLLSSCDETAALRDPQASDRGGWVKARGGSGEQMTIRKVEMCVCFQTDKTGR